MYGAVYRRSQPDVVMVDGSKGVVPGNIVAVNLDGNYRPPHLAEVPPLLHSGLWVVTRQNGCLGMAGHPPRFQSKA